MQGAHDATPAVCNAHHIAYVSAAFDAAELLQTRRIIIQAGA